MAVMQWSLLPTGMLISPKSFGQESNGPCSERRTAPRSIQEHPCANFFCKKDAINLKPQERKRNVVQSHFSKAASQCNHTNRWKRQRFLRNEAKCEEGKKKRLISNFQHVSTQRKAATAADGRERPGSRTGSIWKIETASGSEKGQASWPLEGKK